MSGAAFGELLQRVADAEPGGDGVATLHPAEDPGDGTQVFELPAFGAPRGSRSDAGRVQLIDWSCLLEIFEHVGIVGDLTAVNAIGLLRHFFHGFFPARWMLFIMPRERFQTRRDHQFQIPLGEHGGGIFPVENFALLGNANLARKRSWRLSEDGGMRRSAAAAHRSAAAMEEAKLHSMFLRRPIKAGWSF